MLAQSKREFFRKGPDNQKMPDVVFDVRRVDISKIKQWGDEDKKHLEEFLSDCDKSYAAWRKALHDIINQNP